MLDLDDIKRTHGSDKLIIGDSFLPRGKAIMKFWEAHRHRGLLLDEIERLRRERDKALAQRDALMKAGEIARAIYQEFSRTWRR